MSRYVTIAIFIAWMILAGAQCADNYPREGEVVVLDDSNLEMAIVDFPILFVEFYAEWCGHCQNLKPKWAKLAKTYKERGGKVVFAKIDADKNSKAGERYNIEGFPTLILFMNNEKFEFTDETDVPNIEAFIKKIVEGPVSHLETIAKTIAEGDKVAVLLSSDANSPTSVIFKDICRKHDHITCISTSNKEELRTIAGETTSPSNLYLFKRKGAKVLAFQEELSHVSLDKFFHDHRIELIVHSHDVEDLELLYERKAPPAMIGFFNDENTAEYEAFSKFAHEIGNKGGLKFFVCEKVDGTPIELGPFVGVSQFGRVALLKGSTDYETKRYLLDKPVTVENLRQFHADFKNKKLKVFIRSEEDPGVQSGPIHKITSNTLSKYFPGKLDNFALLVTESHCKKCDRYADLYKKLAEKYGSKLTFGVADVGKNDLHGIEYPEVPSVLFFTKNDKLGAHYSGKSDFEKLESFMKKSLRELFEGQEKVDL